MLQVCKIVAGQPYKKKLSDVQTSNMLVQAARRPLEREREIHDVRMGGVIDAKTLVSSADAS